MAFLLFELQIRNYAESRTHLRAMRKQVSLFLHHIVQKTFVGGVTLEGFGSTTHNMQPVDDD